MIVAGRSSDPDGLINHTESGALPLPATILFRRIQAWCRDLTVNQWLARFDSEMRTCVP